MIPLFVATPVRSAVNVVTVLEDRFVLSDQRVSWPMRSTGHFKVVSDRLQEIAVSSSEAIKELKTLSGLTWGQIADTLGVSARSVHGWADGAGIDSSHESALRRMLASVRMGRDCSPLINRRFLLTVFEGAKTPLDLMREGRFGEVGEALARHSAAHRKFQPWRVAGAELGEPTPVAVLMNAEQGAASSVPFKVVRPKVRRVPRI